MCTSRGPWPSPECEWFGVSCLTVERSNIKIVAMPLKYDATLKDLVRRYPHDWLAGLGLEASGPVQSLDVDLATVSAQTDTVLGLGEPLTSLVNVEFQSGRDPSLPQRLLVYNALLHQRFHVPVHSAVVLLRRQADDPGLTGVLRYETQPGIASLEFRYEVLRIWEQPAEGILSGGLGILPVAPLAALPKDASTEVAVSAVVRTMKERLIAEVPLADAVRLLTAAFVLIGMRLPRSKALALKKEAFSMVDLRDSTTYQLILEEGEANALQRMILKFGTKRLGSPNAADEQSLRAITDVERLERIFDRLPGATGWQELLGTA
jgi:hypothetical protein